MMGKGPRMVSLVGRLSLSQWVLCQRVHCSDGVNTHESNTEAPVTLELTYFFSSSTLTMVAQRIIKPMHHT